MSMELEINIGDSAYVVRIRQSLKLTLYNPTRNWFEGMYLLYGNLVMSRGNDNNIILESRYVTRGFVKFVTSRTQYS